MVKVNAQQKLCPWLQQNPSLKVKPCIPDSFGDVFKKLPITQNNETGLRPLSLQPSLMAMPIKPLNWRLIPLFFPTVICNDGLKPSQGANGANKALGWLSQLGLKFWHPVLTE